MNTKDKEKLRLGESIITDVAARKYKDEQILYDKIYNSFFEREEEIKLKREKNK